MVSLPMDAFPGQGLTEEMQSAIEIEERFIAGPTGAPDVRVLITGPGARLEHCRSSSACMAQPSEITKQERRHTDSAAS
jgi:hypothetical protein